MRPLGAAEVRPFLAAQYLASILRTATRERRFNTRESYASEGVGGLFAVMVANRPTRQSRSVEGQKADMAATVRRAKSAG